MRWSIIIFYFYSLGALAQSVTASFDSSLINENPAATTTRDFGVISPFASQTTTYQEVKDPFDSSTTERWKSDIDLKRYELVFTSKTPLFVPEVYLSHNEGRVSVKSSSGSEQSESRLNLFNNQINLGVRHSQNFRWGLKLFGPKFKYESSGTYKQSTSVIVHSSKTDFNLFGVGLGTTYFLAKSFSVGAHFTGIKWELIQCVCNLFQG